MAASSARRWALPSSINWSNVISWPLSSTFCPSSSGFKSTINCSWTVCAVGEIWLKIFSASLYQRYIRSVAVPSTKGTWMVISFCWPIRSRRPIRCSNVSGLAGKSNNTKSLANWKLRPSEPISEANNTWAPSISAKYAAAWSRSSRVICSVKIAVLMPACNRNTASKLSTVAPLRAISSTFWCFKGFLSKSTSQGTRGSCSSQLPSGCNSSGHNCSRNLPWVW